jgi:hypothetical protein
MDIEKAKESARQWSLDEENLIGEAVVLKDPAGQLSICTDFRGDWEVVARFKDGEEV